MKIFYVIYVRDNILGPYLNAIRYLSNPTEKYDAHITIRGPYKKHINIDNYNKIIENDTIEITAVGKFFEKKQNTVFLQCYSDNLKKIWHKSDYGFKPHITLYDGKSRTFASNLIKILNSHLINFTFKVEKLSELRSIKGQIDYRLNLEWKLEYIHSIVKKNVTHNEIENMNEPERLRLIDEITEHLSFIKAKKKLAVTLNNDKDDGDYDLKILRKNEDNNYTKDFLNDKVVLTVLRNN